MSATSGGAWFESVRTGLADPVLDRRLRRFFDEHPPGPSEIDRRGVVFDLVTGSKRPEDALVAVLPDRDLRARLARLLEPNPDLDEVRAALIEAGRADEAAALEGTSLFSGEFEAKAKARPKRRAPKASVHKAPADVRDPAEERPKERRAVEEAASKSPPRVDGPGLEARVDRPEAGEARVDRLERELRALRSLLEGNDVRPERRDAVEPADGRATQEVLRALDRLEARFDHAISLARLIAVSAIGLLAALAVLAAVLG